MKVLAFTLAQVLLLFVLGRAQTFGDSKLVYGWTTLDFDWPSDSDREEAIKNGTYVPKINMLAGIKVYKDDVYLTVPRWRWTSGHPVTLAKVVSVQGTAKLRPYPDWASQKQGDCQALQYIQSMEIDPNTGLMYAIDSGRVGGSLNLCPAKIIVYDLNTDTEVQRYEMPADVVSPTNNAMNDIVLDYVDGKVRYAYISDVSEGRIHVYDFETRTAHNLEDPSFKSEGNVDGIALSPDFRYVYYCSLRGNSLYQVPTSTLRNGNFTGNNGVRYVGRKISPTGGLAYGSKHLYYGALDLNAVYFWDSDKDMNDQKLGIDKVVLATQVELVKNDTAMRWPDTFGFDEQGWLWFVANNLNGFFGNMGIDVNAGPSVFVWKVYVNETSYLFEADRRTQSTVVG